MGILNKIFATNEDVTKKTEETKSLEGWGSTGTEMSSGILDEEPLQNLTGTEGAKVFDLMPRRDYQIKMNLLAIKSPIESCTYEIVPGGKDKQDIDDADFIRFLLFEDMTPKFSKFLMEMLTMIEQGYCLHEMVDKIASHKRWKNYIGIKKMGFRSQKTIENWNINKDTKDLESVHQQAYGDLEVDTNIPYEYLVHCIIEGVGDNFAGVSMIRPCYGPYIRKEVELKVNVIGMEKFAVPTPIGKTPETGTSPKQLNEFKQSLSNYTSHQSNYMILPYGYDLELFNSKYDPEKVDKAIDSEDRRMAKAFLANFLELMKGGSNALSTDLSDFFLKCLQKISNIISDEVNEKVIKRYIDLNFGPREVYPKLKFSGIEDKPGSAFATSLAALVNASIVEVDEGIENNARRRYGLPLKTENSSDTKKVNKIKDSKEDKPKLSDRIKLAIATRVKKLSDKRS